MKTSHNRKPNRTLAQGFRATFGHIAAPQAGRKSLLAMGTVCLLITGAASADWRVYDDDVHKELRDEIKPRIGDTKALGDGSGSVTGNQKIIFDQHKLGAYKSSGNPVENPQWPAGTASGGSGGVPATTQSGFKLDKFTDMAGTKAAPAGAAMKLDSNVSRCTLINENQRPICEEIVKTENAQFIYGVRFHEMTAKRLERLKEIEDERQGLEDKPENYGKLQDNTNKLLALNTRMALDNAQMESAMQSYVARLAYLRALQAQKTTETLSGKKSESAGWADSLAGLGKLLVGGATMAGALCAVQHDKPGGYEELSWNKSDSGLNVYSKVCKK